MHVYIKPNESNCRDTALDTDAEAIVQNCAKVLGLKRSSFPLNSDHELFKSYDLSQDLRANCSENLGNLGAKYLVKKYKKVLCHGGL